jgi:Tol biopolymer transport system component
VAQFDFSLNGTLVYPNGGANGMVTLQWLDSTGKLQPLPAKPGAYGQPRLSPDGKLVALTVASGIGSDILIYDWQRDTMLKLTFGDGAFTQPAWSPDGRYVAFSANSGIYWTRADGAGKPQPLTQSKSAQWPWSFSSDGKRLAFVEFGSGSGDLWTVPVESEGGRLRAGKAEVFLQTPANEAFPAFSPDGRWIAYLYQSNEPGNSGNFEIYVRASPDEGGKWQISHSSGHFAIWSRNGHELFYRTPDQQIMVVSYTTKGDIFVPDKPRLWNSTRLADTNIFRNLDIHPDGKRFVALMPAEGHPKNQVTFLLNFSDEVRRRMATAK